jgi:multiple sugar transport system permease protein
MATQALTTTVRRRGRALAGTGGRTAALFLVPFFAVFAIAMIAPVIYSLVLSFLRSKSPGLGFGEAKTVFVGLENYVQVFQSETFVEGIARLGLYCLIYIPCMVGGAVVFALLWMHRWPRHANFSSSWCSCPTQFRASLPRLSGPTSTPRASARWSSTPGWRHPDQFPGCAHGPSVHREHRRVGVDRLQRDHPVHRFAGRSPGNPGSRPRGWCRRNPGRGQHQVPLILPALSVIMLFTIIGTLQLFTEPSIISKATASVTSTWVPNLWAYDAASSATTSTRPRLPPSSSPGWQQFCPWPSPASVPG